MRNSDDLFVPDFVIEFERSYQREVTESIGNGEAWWGCRDVAVYKIYNFTQMDMHDMDDMDDMNDMENVDDVDDMDDIDDMNDMNVIWQYLIDLLLLTIYNCFLEGTVCSFGPRQFKILHSSLDRLNITNKIGLSKRPI